MKLLLLLIVSSYTAHAADTSSATEIRRLLNTIEENQNKHAAMPGSDRQSPEEKLLIELAKEVLKLKEENQKLLLQIESLKK